MQDGNLAIGIVIIQNIRVKNKMENELSKRNQRIWTPEEDEFLRKNYLTKSAKQIGDILARTKASIKGRIAILSIYKTENRGRFTKGHIPYNAGTRGVMKANRASYKKGNLPSNTLYDGAITIRTDKNGNKYQWIRLAKANWIHLHRYLWEKEYGPVEKGMQITFKNGDFLDCRLENLELISMKENIARRRNELGYISFCISRDPELRQEIAKDEKLIELKRKQLELKRGIKDARKQTERNAEQSVYAQNQ